MIYEEKRSLTNSVINAHREIDDELLKEKINAAARGEIEKPAERLYENDQKEIDTAIATPRPN